MQEQLKQATRKNQTGMEVAFRAAYSGNVRSTKPLTVGFSRLRLCGCVCWYCYVRAAFRLHARVKRVRAGTSCIYNVFVAP